MVLEHLKELKNHVHLMCFLDLSYSLRSWECLSVNQTRYLKRELNILNLYLQFEILKIS